ncbi:uncharacterized protein LOC135831983 isoform X2 [Planococcus citri]|uniref:uncharacterized protein LOC135831983 isoform X2 n=1 Tax=Planococcus citri TaxID=170843 RepID=UPI0031F8C07F
MNFFTNQGRCRVCGKMLCCSTHQKEHERLEHKEYAYLLDKLPIMCKKCCRNIHSIHDLHARCQPFMDHRFMNDNFSNAVELLNKPSRKRAFNEAKKSYDGSVHMNSLENVRKKLVPVYKFKHTENLRKLTSDAKSDQKTLVIEVNRILVESKQSVFSPQLNVSYRMLLSSIIKSSTPLNEEEKQTIPLAQDETSRNIENLCTPSSEFSTYESPETFSSPVIVISAKKHTPPGIISSFSKRISKKVLKNRRVTFELAKTTDSEGNITIYGTPTATMEVIEEIDERGELDLTIPNSPPRCLLVKFIKRMKNAIHSIPRTITTAWDWGNKKFKVSQSNDEEYDFEIRSPVKKRPKYDTTDSLVF